MNDIPELMYIYKHEFPKAIVVSTCDICGNDIHEGDEYYRICEMSICYDCIDEFKHIAE